jgi:uncharacterized protein
MKVNNRILDPEFVNFRAISNEEGRFFEGYASIFNHKSKPILENGKLFYEIIDRNAFDEVLSDKPDVKLTYNHERNSLLARTRSKTLELSTDDYGLKFRASVPNTTLGNDIYELVTRQDLFENSFAFYVRKGDDVWTTDDEGNNLRTVLKVSRLVDVSIVGDGAYADTTLNAREDIESEDPEIEVIEENSNDAPTLTGDDKVEATKKAYMKKELEYMRMHTHILKLKK